MFVVLNDEIIMAVDYEFINSVIKRQLLDKIGGVVYIGIYVEDIFDLNRFDDMCTRLEMYIANQMGVVSKEKGVTRFVGDSYIELEASVKASIIIKFLVTDSLFVHRITCEVTGTL